MSSQFVAIKLVKNEGQGKELRERFKVRGTPTVIVLSNSGEEIDRIIGFSNRDAFVQKIKDYAAGKGVLKAILEQYRADTLNVKSKYALAKKYTDRMENNKAVKYYRNILKLDPKDEQGFGETSSFHIATYEIWNNNNDAPLLDFLKNSDNNDLLSDGYFNLIDYYNNKKDTVRVYETFEKAVAALPQNAQLKNQYAWSIYEDKLKEKYNLGIELARKALELEPNNADIWDTLAWLLLESGDHKGAIVAMKKAADLNQNYKENLTKMLSATA